jgi:hypothetical protein
MAHDFGMQQENSGPIGYSQLEHSSPKQSPHRVLFSQAHSFKSSSLKSSGQEMHSMPLPPLASISIICLVDFTPNLVCSKHSLPENGVLLGYGNDL